jgi:hypothetical protein
MTRQGGLKYLRYGLAAGEAMLEAEIVDPVDELTGHPDFHLPLFAVGHASPFPLSALFAAVCRFRQARM